MSDDSTERNHEAAGLILAKFSLRPLYWNPAAFRILSYSVAPPQDAGAEVFVQEQLRRIVGATQFSSDLPSIVSFESGRRRYLCRSFVLNNFKSDSSPWVAFVLDRNDGGQGAVLEACRRYHLSTRESETVLHLYRGLTTKEIADRMHISPNTVKQFVRLVMSKTRVTTRAGVLGKLFREH